MQPARATPDTTEGPGPRRTATDSEDLFVRNYDPYRRYDVTLSVSAADGTPAFEERYSFRPGQVAGERDVLPPGTYEVTVALGGCRRKRATCRVGPSPEHTIHVELGNGIVSVTEGLYG